jgi:hypothetical protein
MNSIELSLLNLPAKDDIYFVAIHEGSDSTSTSCVQRGLFLRLFCSSNVLHTDACHILTPILRLGEREHPRKIFSALTPHVRRFINPTQPINLPI